jgi:tRNA-specific 2-thiouridylase
MKKALALISGGLDSILAALLIKNQGIKIQGLAFKSLFFAPPIPPIPQIPIKTIDISKEHLKIVKRPKYGYGKQANPCLDCHLLMLKKAKQILSRYDFIITGDVLGQRPFSQNQAALNLLDKQSGLQDLILRPLSAQLLKPTLPEEKGWVDRNQLLALSGRSRKEQLKLAQKFKLKSYSPPAGGCILTDPQYGQRLFKMLKINPQVNPHDIQLLRLGRHFWYSERSDPAKQGRTLTVLMIVGRQRQENLKLKKLRQKNDVLIEPKFFPGPTILIRSFNHKPSPAILDKAEKLLLQYSPHAPQKLSSKDFKIMLY